MKRKSCLVIGYMNLNFGDDLFFYILFKRYPQVDFYMYPPSVLLDKYKKCYKRFKNVKFYEEEEYYINVRKDIVDKNTPINLFPMICERAKKVDFYINIGGSIFIQNDNWKNDDRFILKELLKDKKAFIIGCNFGPGDSEFTNFYREWFRKFDDICFRDSNSYEIFKSLPNTRKASDIVLINSKKNRILNFIYRKSIAISVIDIDNNKNLKNYVSNYYEWFAKVIKYYIHNGFKINLFSFCNTDGDLNAINQILSRINSEDKKNIKVVEYDGVIYSFLRKFKKNKYVIGTRFHSIFLAITNNQKFIPISYSKKTDNFLKDIDSNIKPIQIKDLNKKSRKNLKYFQVKQNFDAKKQFEKIDEYVKKK